MVFTLLSSRQFKTLSYLEEKSLIAKDNIFYKGTSPLELKKRASEGAASITL